MKKIIDQANENMMADRLKTAAEKIRANPNVPVAIADAVGGSDWFEEYCHVCMSHPISHAFLGCLILGWQLCEEYKKSEQRVYSA